jgi:hypothetical protein
VLLKWHVFVSLGIKQLIDAWWTASGVISTQNPRITSKCW